MFSKLVEKYSKGNLVLQILVGVVLGIIVGVFFKDLAPIVSELGVLFTSTLKAIAPVLVFVLILTALYKESSTDKSNSQMRNLILLYLLGTFLASICAVIVNFLFPISLVLQGIEQADVSSSKSLAEIFKGLLLQLVDNPINALANANYLGILTWAIIAGFTLKYSSKETKQVFNDVSDAVLKAIKFIVKLAPFGIFGLVANSVAQTGASGLLSYARLLIVLVCTMLFVAFVVNAIIVFIYTRKNPYPLIFIVLRHSALYAFFTRSSAANIPMNLSLCEKLNVNRDLYSVSIPLGATINMAGAAVTIATFALATAHTLGIEVNFLQAFFLCIIATFAACGASGVVGGSLLLIPLACSLFQISPEIAATVVGIGFIIGVIQDSVETALNSSTDVLFTAICSKNELNYNI